MKKTTLFLFTILLSVNLFAGDGKIVFSKSLIDAATGETLPPATFEMGEKIYCHVYLPKPLNKYKTGSGNKMQVASFRVFLNGKQYNKINSVLFKTLEDAGVSNFGLVFNDQNKSEFIEAVNSLPDGSYTVRLEAISKEWDDKAYIAAGEFTLKKSATSKVKFGSTFAVVKAKMTDPALEAKIIKVLTDPDFEKHNSNRNFKEKYKLDVVSIKIISPDWTINKNEKTGVVTGRMIDVAIQAKDKGGCIIYVYSMEQQFNGTGYQDSFGGFVGPAHIHRVSGLNELHNKRIDCE